MVWTHGVGWSWDGVDNRPRCEASETTDHVLASWSSNFWSLESTLVKSFIFWELQWPWASHRSYRGPVKTCLEDEHNLVKTVWDLTCTPSEKMAPKLGENFRWQTVKVQRGREDRTWKCKSVARLDVIVAAADIIHNNKSEKIRSRECLQAFARDRFQLFARFRGATMLETDH